MDKLSSSSKKIAKQEYHPKHKKKPMNFNTKMNKKNFYYNNKPNFDLLAIKYPYFEP